jgi:hypothetical protein
MKIKSDPLKRLKLSQAMVAIPANAPIHDHMISERLTLGGLFVVPFILLK